MSKKLLILVLACILVLPLGLTAQERKGANLLIEKLDGEQIRGELITVRESSLLLFSESGVDVSVDITAVEAITIVKKSKSLLGAALGFVIGTTCLAFTSVAAVEGEYSFFEVLPTAMIINIPSAIIGGIIGKSIGRDKTFQIEGKTDSEIRESLEYLRNKARIPDYK